MIKYICSTDKSRYSHIGQQWEKAIWLTREDDREFTQEKILIFLGTRFSFLSIYKNGQSLKSTIGIDGNQIDEIMNNQKYIPETFEYCRQHFCRELTPIKKVKVKELDQLDMFEGA